MKILKCVLMAMCFCFLTMSTVLASGFVTVTSDYDTDVYIYSVDTSKIDMNGDLREESIAYEKWVKENKVEPILTCKSNQILENLTQSGVYLLSGTPVQKGNEVYTPVPVLFSYQGESLDLHMKFEISEVSSDQPDDNTTTPDKTPSDEPLGDKLPQTGLPWMMVGILGVGGIICLIGGIKL